MSGKTNYRRIAGNLRKDVEALCRQLEALREAVNDLTTQKAEIEQENKRLLDLLENERAASHLLRMDANVEKDRRTIAENENFTLKRSLALYANAEGGRADVARLLPTHQINRSGHIA